jgi:hypothetical protein
VKSSPGKRTDEIKKFSIRKSSATHAAYGIRKSSSRVETNSSNFNAREKRLISGLSTIQRKYDAERKQLLVNNMLRKQQVAKFTMKSI